MMKTRNLAHSAVRFDRFAAALAAGAVLALAACAPPPSSDEDVGTVRSALFTNGDFESGTNGTPPPSWTVDTFLNPMTGITLQTPQTRAGLNLQPGGVALTTTMRTAGLPESLLDNDLGPTATLRWPKFGHGAALVNQDGNNENVNSMHQTMIVGPGDVDSVDGQVHVRFVVAPVLENPGHPDFEQPYFFIQATNVTQGGAVLYANFNFSNQTGVPWKTLNRNGTTYVYTDWQLVDVAPGAGVNRGDQVKLELIAAGCSLGGHMGKLYVDGVGPTIPGLFVSGSGPSQVNACNYVTYNLTYENGSATPAAGVTITFNTPPGTTYQSINAPGLVCTTPAVGAAGAINCTVGALAAGAGGTFQITVNVPCADSGTVTAGNYFIQGTGIEALLGPVINTIIGCTADNQCSAGNWCNETAKQCTPTLPNGTPVPNDPAHMNPLVNGSCSAAAGALVCTSGVCDTKDNDCGFALGDGPCTVDTECRTGGVCSVNGGVCIPPGGCAVDADCASTDYCNTPTLACVTKVPNGQSVPTVPGHDPTLDGTCTPDAGTSACASGVCDTNDNLCGLANGDGPCTMGDGPTVCRSGACSTDGTCEPDGGCNVVADCTNSQWCNETSHMCTAKVPNGGQVPSDAGHMNPTLDGTCTPAAGTTTCESGVCDTDNKCGLADGDGPCTMSDGSVVCRSGSCSANGTCEASTGCNVDADCSGGKWCNESMHKCTAKLPNGSHVPNDAPHMDPTLNGMCTPAAGMLTCESGVCDPKDNECGLADGDGPCTMSDGSTICRSGTCNDKGTCGSNGTGGGGAGGATTSSSSHSSSGTSSSNGGAGGSGGAANPNAIVAEGNGVACSASPRSSDGGAGWLLAALASVVATIRRRRRR